MTGAKTKALEVAFSQIDKQFGKGSVMLMGQQKSLNIDVVSTGSILIDQALGVGGLPKGRVVEIYGPEASGKTTLTLHAIAQSQKDGGTCAFIDAEHAMDPVYAASIGIDIENLIISQPDYGEQALEIAEVLRSLFLLKQTKNLSFGEKKMLDQCRDLLAQEISLTDGQEKKEVSSNIDSYFVS